MKLEKFVTLSAALRTGFITSRGHVMQRSLGGHLKKWVRGARAFAREVKA